jgi:hypothetical protein
MSFIELPSVLFCLVLLSMAGRTVGDPVDLNVVLLHQPAPERQLVFFWLPIHVEYLFSRPEILLRSPVTIKTPGHEECLLAPREGHVFHVAVASLTADAFADVDTVIEVDKVGKIIDANPLERLLGPIALSYRFKHGTGIPDLRVASHASVRRRNACKRRLLDRGVTINTIEAEATYVMLMTERHRLNTRRIDVGCVGGMIDLDAHPSDHTKEDQSKDDTCPRNHPHTRVEQLSHSIVM